MRGDTQTDRQRIRGRVSVKRPGSSALLVLQIERIGVDLNQEGG